MKLNRPARSADSRVTVRHTKKELSSPAHAEARNVASQLARAFEALLAAGIGERDIFSDLLRVAAMANPAFLGIWTVWEPNVLTGSDDEFRNAPGHDAEGRFVPYWNRARGRLSLDLATGLESPEQVSWYSVPKERRQPCTAEPYLHSVAGQAHWLASELAPVAARGLCMGVLGVDWSINSAAGEHASSSPAPAVYVVGGGAASERARTLTAREHEVYFWLSQGKSNEEISIILGISAHTVKNHVDHIFQKLGVCNRLAAALAAQSQAL